MEDDQTKTTQEEVTQPEENQEEPKKDRTKEQFDKLTQSNQELKKERDEYKNILESLRPNSPNTPQEKQEPPSVQAPSANQYSHLNQQQVDSITDNFVDDNGYVDVRKLNQFLQDTNQRAIRAEQAAQQARQESRRTVQDFEESNTVKQAHEKYPELDPKSDSFNEEFYDSVRNELVGQMLSGKKEDLLQAASKWHKRMYGPEKKAQKEKEKQEEAQRQEGQQARAAINTTPTGGAKNRMSMADHDNLVYRTRKGDRNALKERLERSGF